MKYLPTNFYKLFWADHDPKGYYPLKNFASSYRGITLGLNSSPKQ